jgi:hypothetical protein
VVRVPARSGNFSLHYHVQADFGAHPASYPMDIKALSLAVKQQGRDLTTHFPPVARSRMRGGIPPLPNTPPWRGAQLKSRDNFTFTLIS